MNLENCRHMDTRLPGDMWPPTCCEMRGHKSDHQSKPWINASGQFVRTTWPNTETAEENAA